MVRNALGVHLAGTTARAASATRCVTQEVLEQQSPSLVAALRAALDAARDTFGEPDGIALAHADGADVVGLGAEAAAAGVGPVRLVPESVARRFHDDVATGAALWLLDERTAVVPLVPVSPLPEEEPSAEPNRRQMSDFGPGRTMSDFGAARSTADFGDGNTMADFGDGNAMADFGAEAPRRQRARLAVVIAAIAALIVVVAGTVAAIGSSGDDAAPVAAIGSTTTQVGDGGGVTPDSSVVPSSTDEGAAAATEDFDGSSVTTITTTPMESTQTSVDAGTATTSATGSTPSTTATSGSMTSRTYPVTAVVQSYAIDAPANPRLKQGDSADAVLTVECPDSGPCRGDLVVSAWNFRNGFSAEIVDGHMEFTSTSTLSDCADGASATSDWSADIADTSAAGTVASTAKPRTCEGTDGTQHFHEDITISFTTAPG